jgi:hypothetical protein
MDSEHWRKIEAIFQEAATLSVADRQRYLEKACAGDAGLRSEVESLLLADARSESPLEGSVLDALDTGDLISHFNNQGALSTERGKGMQRHLWVH